MDTQDGRQPLVALLSDGAWSIIGLAYESSLKRRFPDTVEGLVRHLLISESTDQQERAVRELAERFRRRENQLKITEIPGALAGLVRLLFDDGIPRLREEAARALVNLSLAQENGWEITGHPNALEGLVRLLLNHAHPEAQKLASKALHNLARAEERTRIKIATFPDALRGLVGLLVKDSIPDLPECAARALGNLALSADNTRIIADCPGALAGLVGMVSRSGNPAGQEAAAWALNLLVRKELCVKLKVANFPRAISSLVDLLSSDETKCDESDQGPIVRRKLAAIGTLIKLAGAHEETQVAIASYPFALFDLVKLLFSDSNPTLQEYAVTAVRILAQAQENMQKIVDFPNALVGLVGMLFKSGNPRCQEQAAWALDSLAKGGKRIILQIARQQHAVEGLVALLFYEESNGVQRQLPATSVLVNLASAHENRTKIAETPLALEGLVRLMSKDGSLELRAYAAMALSNLARTQSNKLKIAQLPDALKRLVDMLWERGNSIGQEQAARALGYLARGEDLNKFLIARYPQALSGLVEILFQDASVGVQIQAAKTLAELASAAANVDLIAEDGDALEGLVKMLFRIDDPLLSEYAAMTLAGLARDDGRPTPLQRRIAGVTMCLAGLVDMLQKYVHPGCQKQAARALANLCNGGDCVRLEIASCCNCLPSLVRMLSNEEVPDLQECAATLCANLASAQHNRQKILKFQEAVESLVALSIRSGKPRVQEQAIRALSNIAQGNEAVKVQIGNIYDALPGLVAVLQSRDASTAVQVQAAKALAELATARDNIIVLAQCPGVFQGLVNMLSTTRHSLLPEYAAMILGSLARRDLSDMQLQGVIVQTAGSLAGLVGMLLRSDSLGGQKAATIALANLACGEDKVNADIAAFHRCVPSLVSLLSKEENPELQEFAALALGNLAATPASQRLLSENEGALAGLISLAQDPAYPGAQRQAGKVLTSLLMGDPKGNANYSSASAGYLLYSRIKSLLTTAYSYQDRVLSTGLF